MTKFAVNGSVVTIVDHPPVIEQTLPTKVYALKASMEIGLFLEEIEEFSIPDRLFGTVGETSERVIQTFNERPGVTGILLTGEKGSGKTLLGKKVAMDLMKTQDMPVIVVNIPVSGDDFGIFLQKLGRPVTLFFDEFEKIYGREEFQNGMLTILDGVYPVKMMAILTANDSKKMIGPLIDRPGRIYYKIDYRGLEYQFIMEYAQEKLKNKEHLKELGRLALMANLNFDQLQALIEEMNRYDEPVKEAVQLLNINLGGENKTMRVVRMTCQGKPVPEEAWNTKTFYGSLIFDPEQEAEGEDEYGNPIDGGISFGYMTEAPEEISIYDYRKTVGVKKFNTIRQLWSRLGYADGHEKMPGIPVLLNFNSKSAIEVNRSGQITMTNANGDSITLEPMVYDYSKRF